MSVKNGLPHLGAAIESLRMQTYSRWEAVIVDDGSTDGTGEYLARLSRDDARFKIIPTRGVGRGNALNMALGNASGEYLTNLDADDAAHPSRFEVQVDFMESLEISFLACGATLLIGGGEPSWQPIERDKICIRDVSEILMLHNPICHSSVMMRCMPSPSPIYYDGTRSTHFDYELWARLAKQGVKILKLDAPLAAKRIHSAQSYENKEKIRYTYSSFRLQNQIISDFGGGPWLRAVALGRMAYRFLPQVWRAGLKRGLTE